MFRDRIFDSLERRADCAQVLRGGEHPGGYPEPNLPHPLDQRLQRM